MSTLGLETITRTKSDMLSHTVTLSSKVFPINYILLFSGHSKIYFLHWIKKLFQHTDFRALQMYRAELQVISLW